MSNSRPATPSLHIGATDDSPLHLALPLAFVALYGSGFVGAKYGLPYSPPLTFLVLRFLIAASLIACLASVLRAPWPRSLKQTLHIGAAGVLTVSVFSAGVFISISMGLSPALSALIMALQPILVAVLARRLLGERLSPSQWLGLGLGLIGVAFVVGHKVRFDAHQSLAVLMSVIGLVGLTLGNLYQKKHCANMNIYTGGAIQSAASAIVLLPLAWHFESMRVVWHAEFIGALAYMSVGVSIGALSLFYVMVRRGDVSRVASVFYLVPVSAAIMSYLIYGEQFDYQVGIGIAVIAAGVYLVNSIRKGN